jgi:cell division septation protein DedD
MSPDRDNRNDDLEPDTYEEEPPRSIFAATWFRAVLILIVLGVIGAVAVPYILDAVNPPPTQQAVVKSAPLPAAPPSPPPVTARPPAGPTAATPAEEPAPARALPPPSTPRLTAPPVALPDSPKPAAPAAKTPGPLAKADVPAAKPPAPASKPEPADPRPETPAKSSASSSRAGSPDSTTPKPTANTSTPATAKAAAKKPPASRQAAAKTAPAATGVYWVQVGAFKDEATAKRLAATLRDQNFKVADVTGGPSAPAASAATPAPTASPGTTATPVPAGADQYDVFVTGLPPAELNTRLTAKGLAAEPSGAGVVIKPSLPLRDAVALSKDLAMEGYKVQVRRAGGGTTARAPARPQPPATAAASAPAAADGLYRVRVGSFTERAAAVAALRELEAKGYKPFIARGER